MALKLFPIPFPIFASPLNPNPSQNPSHRQSFEVRFARWNNANAREFEERRRAQEDIEDDIRRHRRFDSVDNIVQNYDPATRNTTTQTFKSIGTPSSPSTPSIPGKKSKYSKPAAHPAFRRVSRITEKPQPAATPIERNAKIKLSEDGLSFVVDGAPFEFKYSYTETPKIKPVKLREPPFSPFGPTTMNRPWTGRAPLPPSRRKSMEFDSFKLPPPDKKGVKPVQKPGPFLEGTGPRYVYTREEILGDPLTKEEVKDLIEGCVKTKRQLNMGRDGLTHNMLDNIHAHWKRRRVCKIKCKGVCTVDMNNVCQQLEERTGGKIIYRKAGIVFLFRGRNYNYRTRPRFPLMLWKPVTPMYPRLIQRVPEGLTLSEATEMRKKGRNLIPICKLAKNGVYHNLVKEVREAFEVCELVRINCQGVKGSDYKKVGGKLKELVPCVLISFENEHILMWRGREWKSSLTKPVNDCEEGKGLDATNANSITQFDEDQKVQVVNAQSMSTAVIDREEEAEDQSAVSESNPTSDDEGISALNGPETIRNTICSDDEGNNLNCANEMPIATSFMHTSPITGKISKSNLTSDDAGSSAYNESETISTTSYSEAALNNGYANDIPVATLMEPDTVVDTSSSTREMIKSDSSSDDAVNAVSSESTLDNVSHANEMPVATSLESSTVLESVKSTGKLQDALEGSHDVAEQKNLSVACVDGVLQLLKQAVESGSAVVLTEENLDADTVYEKTVAFAKSAPPGPVFSRQKPKKVLIQKSEKQEREDFEPIEVTTITPLEESKTRNPKPQRNKRPRGRTEGSAPLGSLKIDELAKLLA